MGHVKKILALKKIQPIPTFYSDNFSVELPEDFHIHLRNIRIECDHAEFETIAKTFCGAWEKWNKLGRPTKKEENWRGGYFHKLGMAKIQPIPLLFNNEIINDELRVEIQNWADCIHLHYKQLRIEFTIKEFREFIRVIKEASSNLEEYAKDNPKRFGKFQQACPHNRAIGNNRGFWLNPKDNIKSKPYDTTYPKEDIRKDARIVDDDKLAKLDIRDLFDITLFHSKSFHSWGCNEDGVLLPLFNRYEFVKKVMESPKDLSEEEIKDSDYYKLLTRRITDKPRDGGRGWIYKDPIEQCQRFVSLIKSIKTYGYFGTEKSHISYSDFESILAIIEADGKISYQKNKDGGFPGLISVMPSSGAYKVHNGLHRLAILKYLWDAGQLSSPLILVRKWDDSPFDPSDTGNIKYDEKGYPIGRLENFIDRVKQPLAKEKNRVLRAIRRRLSHNFRL